MQKQYNVSYEEAEFPVRYWESVVVNGQRESREITPSPLRKHTLVRVTDIWGKVVGRTLGQALAGDALCDTIVDAVAECLPRSGGYPDFSAKRTIGCNYTKLEITMRGAGGFRVFIRQMGWASQKGFKETPYYAKKWQGFYFGVCALNGFRLPTQVLNENGYSAGKTLSQFMDELPFITEALSDHYKERAEAQKQKRVQKKLEKSARPSMLLSTPSTKEVTDERPARNFVY